jgi:tetratricopeptide (TPR) repeat protein
LIRAEESRPNEDLSAFQAFRYSRRYHYLLNDTALVHQDFGTHGIAAAVVLEKRPHAVAAARLAQRANADYVLRFLDAHVKGISSAAEWLARTPEENGFSAGAITLERYDGVTPAPSPGEFMALVEQHGASTAMERFHAGRQADSAAAIYQEQVVNQLGYQLMANGQRDAAIEIFRANVAFYPSSANTYDSLSEAYETMGDSANAVRYARRTLEVAPAEARLPQATRDNLLRISQERIRRLGGEP